MKLSSSPPSYTDHLRGHRRGGFMRAHGLHLIGVVLKVYRPDDRPDREDVAEAANMGVTCQVLTYGTGNRWIFENVPVVARGGLNDQEFWIPHAASMALNGGSLNLEAEGVVNPNVTDPRDLDGDHVVITFLNDDLRQPVIIGCIPHPRGNRRPSSNDSTLYQMQRWIRSMRFGVTEAGDIDVDTTGAGDGELSSDGTEQPKTASGNATIKIKNTATLRIEIDGSSTVLEVTKDLVKIIGSDVEINNPDPSKGVARIGDAVESHAHGPITFALSADLATGAVSGTITAAFEAPQIAEGSGTVRAGD